MAKATKAITKTETTSSENETTTNDPKWKVQGHQIINRKLARIDGNFRRVTSKEFNSVISKQNINNEDEFLENLKYILEDLKFEKASRSESKNLEVWKHIGENLNSYLADASFKTEAVNALKAYDKASFLSLLNPVAKCALENTIHANRAKTEKQVVQDAFNLMLNP